MIIKDKTRLAKMSIKQEINVAYLRKLLLGEWHQQREASFALIQNVAFQREQGLSVRDHRDWVLKTMFRLSEGNFAQLALPQKLGGENNPSGTVAAFEEFILSDPSLAIKSGVQWGLFGAAVLHLGTEKHHKQWLDDIISLRTLGSFAMTETGHGSDVASIQTTAIYNPATKDFIINTPNRSAWKDYIGNAAENGVATVVFAQLITQGENHGVHAFYVPIRNPKTMEFLEGIGGEDDGAKGGLNGVDNGRLHFTNVHIPRFNLLNKYGDISEDGTYSSPIASKGRRFFTMIGTLVQGRVSLDGSAVLASKYALTIAINYASQRRQFATEKNGEENLLLDYGRHQRRLVPRIAKVIAMSFAHEELLEKFQAVFSNEKLTDTERQELETYASMAKPLSTWFALHTLQEAREALGGQGFLAVNKVAPLRADMDIWTTFEGDNNVLLQLAGKRLLTEYVKDWAEKPMAMLIRSTRGRVNGSIKDLTVQHRLLNNRVIKRIDYIGKALGQIGKMESAEGSKLFNQYQNDLILAAKAKGELIQWEAFRRALDKITDVGTKSILSELLVLFGLTLIEEDLGWFESHNYIEGSQGEHINEIIDREFLPSMRPHLLDLVESFGIPESLLPEIARLT